MINKSLENKSKEVTLYVLDDGYNLQLLDDKDIRKRAFELSQAEWMPSLEDAICFLDSFYGETIKPVKVIREDLIYFAYEVL